MKKKFRIKQTANIGSPDAETDEMLFDVFVKNDILEEIIDTKSQKSILLGRTGSGKSAIIKYVEKNCEKVTRIEPEALSLQFLSNSTILKYFRDLGINLNFFFKILWKHVFVVELLKLYFPEDYNNEKKEIWFNRIKASIRKKVGKTDPKKEKALKYLDNWTDKFWNETEYRIKELEKTVVENFQLATGYDINSIIGNFSTNNEQTQKSLVDIKHKAESVIHEVQSKELIEIFNFMKSDLFIDHQKKFYIIIDDLDQEWIEASFRYDLIGAMVEVIKEFRQFTGSKIIISLRENLSELLKLGSKHEGGQREKFRPLYAPMDWNKAQLKKLVDNRLKSISSNQLDVTSAFYFVRRSKELGIDYVLDRTYMRPRDVISFINYAIMNANSKPSFSKDIIYKAEIPYSLDRFQALEDEWRENYGEIAPICNFLNWIPDGFKLKTVSEDNFADIYFEENPENLFKGAVLEAVQSWRSEKINFPGFLKKIIFFLYHIGIIGVKKGPRFPTAFFYNEISITREDISNNNKYYVHPSLYSHFKVNTLEQLPE